MKDFDKLCEAGIDKIIYLCKSGFGLWMGMYLITCVLFWIESGSFVNALVFALVSSSLKTTWAIVHRKLFHTKVQCSGEGIRIDEPYQG